MDVVQALLALTGSFERTTSVSTNNPFDSAKKRILASLSCPSQVGGDAVITLSSSSTTAALPHTHLQPHQKTGIQGSKSALPVIFANQKKTKQHRKSSLVPENPGNTSKGTDSSATTSNSMNASKTKSSSTDTLLQSLTDYPTHALGNAMVTSVSARALIKCECQGKLPSQAQATRTGHPSL